MRPGWRLAAAGLEPHPRMSGISFLALLKGEPYTPRKHIFVERGPHGSAPVSVNMSNSGYDLSRTVRSDRYKFIYNCTPWIPYGPVDSAGGPAKMAIITSAGTARARLKIAACLLWRSRRLPHLLIKVTDSNAR